MNLRLNFWLFFYGFKNFLFRTDYSELTDWRTKAIVALIQSEATRYNSLPNPQEQFYSNSFTMKVVSPQYEEQTKKSLKHLIDSHTIINSLTYSLEQVTTWKKTHDPNTADADRIINAAKTITMGDMGTDLVQLTSIIKEVSPEARSQALEKAFYIDDEGQKNLLINQLMIAGVDMSRLETTFPSEGATAAAAAAASIGARERVYSNNPRLLG
jgi:hypothetical protein